MVLFLFNGNITRLEKCDEDCLSGDGRAQTLRKPLSADHGHLGTLVCLSGRCFRSIRNRCDTLLFFATKDHKRLNVILVKLMADDEHAQLQKVKSASSVFTCLTD